MRNRKRLSKADPAFGWNLPSRFLVLGEEHLQYLVTQYVDFYNTVRPHGAMGGPLEPSAMPAEGPVLCEHRLGGLLKHYYRKAA